MDGVGTILTTIGAVIVLVGILVIGIQYMMATPEEAAKLKLDGMKGTNPEIDLSIRKQDAIKEFLLQSIDADYSFEEVLGLLEETVR